MATREETTDSFYKANKEAFELLDRQFDIAARVNNANKQMKEIQDVLRDGPDTLIKLQMSIKYDREQFDANRTKIAELLKKQ